MSFQDVYVRYLYKGDGQHILYVCTLGKNKENDYYNSLI